jgi:hypothetical protein
VSVLRVADFLTGFGLVADLALVFVCIGVSQSLKNKKHDKLSDLDFVVSQLSLHFL